MLVALTSFVQCVQRWAAVVQGAAGLEGGCRALTACVRRWAAVGCCAGRKKSFIFAERVVNLPCVSHRLAAEAFDVKTGI